MKQIILGTAGHIDHGKTSLIKAITGTDTDRLKEEKLRGITIELGFAAIDLPTGQHLGIVDVPGHEKFVKNMVAGATGIDIVAMVIAADEGVMPQTREHMEICQLLGIRHGLVALTKVDMVEEEWLELVMDDVQGFTRGTFLEEAPIMPVSSATGDGLQDFVKALDDLAAEIPQRVAGALFRLPVDRVFTMKGFGTVITGTLISGNIGVGETIQLYPSGTTSKVRGIQVHNQGVEMAQAGMRTAINFQGLDREATNRGDVLARPETLISSYMVDVQMAYLSSNKKPLKNRTLVRFHTGTSEIMGRLILLDREELTPGEEIVAQVRLDEPVALVRDDRYVLRSYSPIRTIGGGRILDPIPVKHKRLRPDVVETLEQLNQAQGPEIIALKIRFAGYLGTSFSALMLMTNISEKRLQQAIQELLSKREAVLVDREARVYLHRESFDRYKEEARERLAAYHGENPLKPGMPKEELKSRLPAATHAKLFNLMLNQMIKENLMVQEEETVRLSDHKVSLAIDEEELKGKILAIYQTHGLTPPYLREVTKELDVDGKAATGVMAHMVDQGLMIKVKEDLYYHREHLENLKERLVNYLKENEEITTPQFKDMTGASRKYVIPLIEHFDATKITIRIGDIRKLRKRQ